MAQPGIQQERSPDFHKNMFMSDAVSYIEFDFLKKL